MKLESLCGALTALYLRADRSAASESDTAAKFLQAVLSELTHILSCNSVVNCLGQRLSWCSADKGRVDRDAIRDASPEAPFGERIVRKFRADRFSYLGQTLPSGYHKSGFWRSTSNIFCIIHESHRRALAMRRLLHSIDYLGPYKSSCAFRKQVRQHRNCDGGLPKTEKLILSMNVKSNDKKIARGPKKS